MYYTEDIINQHILLNQVSELLDQKVLKTTVNKTLSPIHAANIRKAHEIIETGSTIGKIVLETF